MILEIKAMDYLAKLFGTGLRLSQNIASMAKRENGYFIGASWSDRDILLRS